MDNFIFVLILLFAIGLSNIIHHFTPFIPVPLIQIALGLLLAAIPDIHISMEPGLFFVLFIAPLLFNDGRNVSREALWKLRKPILLLVLGLVFFTVFLIGFFIHWMIPSIPLPAAFALAAILSPTDVVAVSAISDRVSIPGSIMHLLQGEGLMNDASGLVAFKFAVAATVTGSFSLVHAGLSFLAISIGGFLGGALLAFIIIRVRGFFRRLGMEDVTLHMLIQILTPFIIYLVIEHFHLSGILAVVAAGIVHGIKRDKEESPTVQLQVVSKSTWTVILYIINGLVFILLGLQVLSVIQEIVSDPIISNFVVVKYVLLISASLLVLRFLWVYLFWMIGWKLKDVEKPSLRFVTITTLSGVRGAVTLAGAFSLPFTLANGDPFPERALIIFISAGVILTTLVIASIFLPLIAKEEEEDQIKLDQMEKKAFILTQEAAIHAVRASLNDDNRDAAAAVISIYKQNLDRIRLVEEKKESNAVKNPEVELRLRAMEAECCYIMELAKAQKIDPNTAFYYQEYIRRREIAISNKVKYKVIVLGILIKRTIYLFIKLLTNRRKEIRKKLIRRYKQDRHLKIEMAEAAIQALQKGQTEENRKLSALIIGEYKKLIIRYKHKRNASTIKKFARMQRELQFKAYQAERDQIQHLYERGKISLDITRKIRQQINIRESSWE